MAHVGDSRVYVKIAHPQLNLSNQFQQVGCDDNMAQTRINAGLKANSDSYSILTRYLGGMPYARPDAVPVIKISLPTGSTVCLATDGLYDNKKKGGDAVVSNNTGLTYGTISQFLITIGNMSKDNATIAWAKII